MPIYITCVWQFYQLHDSIVVSIPACHAGDRGSIPRRRVLFIKSSWLFMIIYFENLKCSEKYAKCESSTIENEIENSQWPSHQKTICW